MKNNMKQISRKALAVVIALAIVVSCVTISFSTFATAGNFEVPAKSPAVPLYVGKTLAVSELSIEVGDSNFVQGDELTWTLAEGNSATLDEAEGVLTGAKAGVTRFVVSDGNETQNVYVIVNAEGNDVFNIAAVDFTKGEYDADEWIEAIATIEVAGDYSGNGWNNGDNRYGIYSTGKFRPFETGVQTETVNVGGQDKVALKIPDTGVRFSTSAAFYKNAALDDFSDVAIKYNASYVNRSADLKNGSPIAAAGILARAKMNPNYDGSSDTQILASDIKTYSFRLRAYGGLVVNSINGNDISLYEAGESSNNWETTTIAAGQGYTWSTNNLVDRTTLIAGDSFNSDYTMYPDAFDAETLTKRTVEITLEGNGIKYSMNGHAIFDSSVTQNGTCLDYAVKNEPFAYKSGENKNLSAYQNYTNNINVYNGGTIAFVNNCSSDNFFVEGVDSIYPYDPQDLYVYDFAIAPLNIKNAEAFPEYGEGGVGGDVITEDITVPVNARFDLSEYATDWADYQDATYEIKNNVLNIYAPADAFDITNDAEDVVLTVTVEDAGAEIDGTTAFAPAYAVVAPANEGYTVSLNYPSKYLNADLDTLFVVDGDNRAPLFNFVSDDGQTFAFNANADTFVIEGSTIDGYNYLFKAYTLGATKRTTAGAESMRFMVAFPQVRVGAAMPGEIDLMSFYGGQMSYGGDAIIDLNTVGALVIPTALLKGSSLTTADMSSIAKGYATVNGVKAAAVQINKLSAANSLYSQAWVTLNLNTADHPEIDKLNLDYTVVPYVEFIKEGGFGYIFGTEMTRNYNAVGDAGDKPVDEVLHFSYRPDKTEVKRGDVVTYTLGVENCETGLPLFGLSLEMYPDKGLSIIDGSSTLNLESKAKFGANMLYAFNEHSVYETELNKSIQVFSAYSDYGYSGAGYLPFGTIQYKVDDDVAIGTTLKVDLFMEEDGMCIWQDMETWEYINLPFDFDIDGTAVTVVE